MKIGNLGRQNSARTSQTEGSIAASKWPTRLAGLANDLGHTLSGKIGSVLWAHRDEGITCFRPNLDRNYARSICGFGS